MSYLSIEKVNTFYKLSHVLFDLSMKIEKGESVCLLGKNGAGKTTTIKTIMGVLTPLTGSIKFDGKNITVLPSYDHVEKGFAYVPQGRRIFSNLTVEENLKVAWRNRRGNAWNINSIYEVFPVLKILTTRMGNQLSGGERQMLAVARALVGNPDILLFDEPCEGLAPLIVQAVGEVLERLKYNITILLAEQNVKFALMHSERGYLLDNGSIKHEAMTHELMNDEEIKTKYLSV